MCWCAVVCRYAAWYIVLGVRLCMCLLVYDGVSWVQIGVGLLCRAACVIGVDWYDLLCTCLCPLV